MDPISRAKDLELLPLSQSDTWMKTSHILDMIKVTTTDTGLAFFEFRKRGLTFNEYLVFLKDLCKVKDLKITQVKYSMRSSPIPVHPLDIKKKPTRVP